MNRFYPHLSIQEFGKRLLESDDLDPVYVALTARQWPEEWLHRWLIVYWCFYSCPVACWLAEQEDFTVQFALAAADSSLPPVGERWPRGCERRHFRGKQAVALMSHLNQWYNGHPEWMINDVMREAPNYKAIAARVQEHRGFGPWMSFKIADMIDRVLRLHVDFSEAEVFMFKDPAEAALMYWRQKKGLPFNTVIDTPATAIHDVVTELIKTFSGYTAPPFHDRPVNLQEIETILCKWKSHLHGHYPVNNDIHEIREATEKWADVSTVAAQFLDALPKEVR